MAVKHVYFDNTEIILAYPQKKKYISLNLTYDQIIRIQFDKCKEFRLFRWIDSEKITIVNRKTEKPIEYFMFKEKKYFDEYKHGFLKFAKDNRIRLANNLVQEASM